MRTAILIIGTLVLCAIVFGAALGKLWGDMIRWVVGGV